LRATVKLVCLFADGDCMAPKTLLSTVFGRRLGLASFLAVSALAGVALAASGDPHAPPSKPEKPAAAPTKPAPSTRPHDEGSSKASKPAPKSPATGGGASGGHDSEERGEHPTAPSKSGSHAGPPKAGAGANKEQASPDAHPEHAAHSDAAEGMADEAHHPAASASPAETTTHDTQGVSAEQALRRLVEGNARFVHDLDNQTDRKVSRRAELAGGQHPFAIILSCADSRVPPELVFDTDLGDLFVVRVAGNTADDATLGSIEYAIDHLGSKLIVVMGHTKCGAVKAAVDTAGAGQQAADLPGHLPAVVDAIMPAVADTKSMKGDPVRLAVIRNIQRTVKALEECGPVLANAVASKGVQVVGAIYDLETGEVDLVREPSPSGAAREQTAGAHEKANAEAH
jgi:carbonic anhydrase